jgi:uncharacterized protein YjbI with pentapeptide repeats
MRRPAVERYETFNFKSIDDLRKVGFTRAQAEGVIISRNQTSNRSTKSSALKTEAYEATDLRDAGFTPDQLRAAGFGVDVVVEAGFEPAVLAGSMDPTSIEILSKAGYTAAELIGTGFTPKQLRAAGYTIDTLRREAKLSVTELRVAGFIAAQLKDAGFSGRDLKEAGYSLAAMRKAGFTAAQLGKKSGFTLEELKEAGYMAVDLRPAGFSPQTLLSVGFSQIEVGKAGFTHSELEGKPTEATKQPVDVLAAARKLRQQHQQYGSSRRQYGDGSAAPSALPGADEPLPDLGGLLQRPAAKAVIGPSGRVYRGASLLPCLRPGTEPRRTAIFLVESSLFEPMVLTAILLNVVTMAWESPLDPPGTPKAALLALCESTFLGVYTVELLVKVLAFGFLTSEGAYLRDPWCQLDFAVVSLAWVPILFPNNTLPNLSVVRSVRALRPLRTLRFVPGMPVLVRTILDAIPKMANVGLLCAFLLLVFGIFGMQVYHGQLHYRCALPGYAATLDPVTGRSSLLPEAQRNYDTEVPCSLADDASCAGVHEDGETACAYFSANPGGGLLSFDNFGEACVVMLMAFTFDDWATPMYLLMKSGEPLAWIYFVLVVVLGGFFVSNLFLAVIFDAFVAEKVAEEVVDEVAARTVGGGTGNAAVAPDLTDMNDDPAPENHLLRTPPKRPQRLGAIPEENRPNVKLLAPGMVHSDSLFEEPPFRNQLRMHSTRAELLRDRLVLAASDSDRRSEAVHLLELRLVDTGRREPWSHLLCSCARFKCCRPEGESEGAGCSLEALATSSALASFSTALVLVNMLIMCLPYEGMPPSYAEALELACTAITGLFVLEMALKLCGLGCLGYWSDNWNVLDGLIVIESVVDVLLTDFFIVFGDGTDVPKLSFLRVLRMLRVVRVLKLMRSWSGLYKIIVTFGAAISQISNLFVLMSLVIIIFSLIGMQLFGGLYNPSTGYSSLPCPGGVCPDPELQELPHYHFDYFAAALQTVFILMTGAWVDPMSPATDVLGPIACLYFIVAVIIGRYLIMNLFVGILLNSFSDVDASDETGKSSSPPTPPTTDRALLVLPEDGSPAPTAAPQSSLSDSARLTALFKRRRESYEEFEPKPPLDALGLQILEEDGSHLSDEGWPNGHALLCFGPRNPLRRTLYRVVQHPLFDSFIIVIVLASSVALTLDSPRLEPDEPLAQLLHTLDYVWMAIFVLELLAKSIAFGFLNGRRAYLRSVWNQLDGLIVLASLLVMLAESFPVLLPLKALRILRVLRPLRIISRAPAMKLIVTSLAKALPAASNAFGLLLAIQSVFAILGMQLFMGDFASCSDPSILTAAECVGDSSRHHHHHPIPHNHRQLRGGSGSSQNPGGVLRWASPTLGSFDDFGSAMRLLYVMSTGDNWEAPMYMMMAATEPGHAPVRNDYSPAAFFSILWMFVGSFFALNLFVGVICDSFNKIKRETHQSATMTQEQQQWVDTMRAAAKLKPSSGARPPAGGVHRKIFDMVQSPPWEAGITIVILANVSLMACDYWDMDTQPEVLAAFNATLRGFGYIYYAEACIKLLALGPAGYFGDGWCRFDFFLVCASLIEEFASGIFEGPMPPFVLRFLRLLRILRILRLLRGARELRDLVMTMVLSVPALINVSSLLALVVFMYAVLGVFLFTFLAPQQNINEERNFVDLRSTSLLLFQVLTGDAWSGLMTDAMLDEASGLCEPARSAGNGYGTCGGTVSIPYFISFMFLGSFVFLNLIVAVILENFSTLSSQRADLVAPGDIDNFKEAWTILDPDADNFIPSKDLLSLVLALPPPLGLKGTPRATEAHAKRMCLKLNVAQSQGHVSFHDVLHALVKYSYQAAPGMLDAENLESLHNKVYDEGVEQPGSPELPQSKTKAALLSEAALNPKLKRRMNVDERLKLEAEEFALDLPSARRVFAMSIIASHAIRWVRRHEQKRRAKATLLAKADPKRQPQTPPRTPTRGRERTRHPSASARESTAKPPLPTKLAALAGTSRPALLQYTGPR